MVQLEGLVLFALATSALGQSYAPMYANLTWQPPRTLSNWSNLTVKTSTGAFIGMYNDTYPNVCQFLRVPFAQVSSSPANVVVCIVPYSSLLPC